MKNTKSIKSNTGYKGIYFDKRDGKFESQIVITKHVKGLRKTTKHYVGKFDTIKEAVNSREEFITSLY